MPGNEMDQIDFSTLVEEFRDDGVSAIVLMGSLARGNAGAFRRRCPEGAVVPVVHPAYLLGQSGVSLSRVSKLRFLCVRMGPVRASQFTTGGRQPQPRVQLLLGDALQETVPDHLEEPPS